MEALVHNKPNRRGKFAELCSKGYVLGTDFVNFQLQKMWMKYTRHKRVSATVFHKHKYITNAGITPEDEVISAVVKLEDNIEGCMSHHLRETTLEQLEQIDTILKQSWMQKSQKHPPVNPPTPPPSSNCNMQVTLPQKNWVFLPVPHKVSNPHLLFQPPKP